MNGHTVRTLLASAAIAIALAGCDTDGTSSLNNIPPRAMKPLSGEMLSLLEQKSMPKESPILVRIFKEEAEMEVWKQNSSGQFALLKTYPICRWSGELGPKIKEGDRQAPEGFYTITPSQMNPNSNYYLSFNLGFPNAFDRANDRTGAFLMVHGDCSSAGCYAMTDEQMGEIYALGREAFFGGQRSFQVQAYPFRMTALNLAKHRNSPHMAFWRMLKEGNDHFEVTKQEPKVDVCEKHYIFDATTSGKFDPRGKCPAYQVPDEIASAVKEKQDRDEREFAALVSRGTPTVAVKTGADGGMHPLFLAKLRSQEKFDDSGRVFSLASTTHVPDMGPNVNPPRLPAGADTVGATAPQAPRVATTDAGSNSNLFGSLFNSLNPRSSNPPPPSPPPVKPRPAEAKPVHKPALAAAHGPAHPQRPQATVEQKPAATTAAPAASSAQAAAPAQPAATASAAPAPSLMAGAQPVVSANSFESRWGGLR